MKVIPQPSRSHRRISWFVYTSQFFPSKLPPSPRDLTSCSSSRDALTTPPLGSRSTKNPIFARFEFALLLFSSTGSLFLPGVQLCGMLPLLLRMQGAPLPFAPPPLLPRLVLLSEAHEKWARMLPVPCAMSTISVSDRPTRTHGTTALPSPLKVATTLRASATIAASRRSLPCFNSVAVAHLCSEMLEGNSRLLASMAIVLRFRCDDDDDDDDESTALGTPRMKQILRGRR